MEAFSALLAICAGNPGEILAHKGPWHGAFMFSLICVLMNDWVNKREAGDLRRYRTRYDVIIVMNILQREILIQFTTMFSLFQINSWGFNW